MLFCDCFCVSCWSAKAITWQWRCPWALKALHGANLLTLQKDSVRQCCSKYKAHRAYHQETVYVWLHWILRHKFTLNYVLYQVTQLQHKASIYFNVSDMSGCFCLLSLCFIICFIVLSIFRRVTNGLTLHRNEGDHITQRSLQNECWGAFICHHHICLVTTSMNRKLTKSPLTHSYKTPGVSSILKITIMM